MQQITIANKDFNLYTLDGNTSVMETIEESRTYNHAYYHGNEYFIGYVSITLKAYYVHKSQIQKAISLIKNFIQFITTTIKEQDLGREDYMESFDDFHMFHKNIENFEYDIFFNHFDIDNVQVDTKDHRIFQAFDVFQSNFQELSDFYITAGYEVNDISLDYIALGFFKNFQPDVFEKVAMSFGRNMNHDWVDPIGGDQYKNYINETDDEMIIQNFFIDYFSNTPIPIEDSYIETQMLYKIIENFKKLK